MLWIFVSIAFSDAIIFSFLSFSSVLSASEETSVPTVLQARYPKQQKIKLTVRQFVNQQLVKVWFL